MSKVIANAVKYGKLSEELGKWWSTKQTLYAKEQSEWQKIEDMFTDWYRKKYLGLERITKTLIDNEKHIMTSKTQSTVAL